jgi:hypothetical protein
MGLAISDPVPKLIPSLVTSVLSGFRFASVNAEHTEDTEGAEEPPSAMKKAIFRR